MIPVTPQAVHCMSGCYSLASPDLMHPRFTHGRRCADHDVGRRPTCGREGLCVRECGDARQKRSGTMRWIAALLDRSQSQRRVQL